MSLTLTTAEANAIDDALNNVFIASGQTRRMSQIFVEIFSNLIGKDTVLNAVSGFNQNASGHSGLYYAYTGANIDRIGSSPLVVAAGTVLLTGSATNYVEFDPAGSGTVSANTSGFTGGDKKPIAIVVTNASSINPSNVTDRRGLFTALLDRMITPAKIGGELLNTNELPTVEISAGSGYKDVVVTTKNADGTAKSGTAYRLFEFQVVDTQYSTTVAGTAPDTIAAQTGSVVNTIVSGKHVTVMSSSAGVATLRVSEDGTDTWYVNVFYAGRLLASIEVAFT